jgi:hypothetical protein
MHLLSPGRRAVAFVFPGIIVLIAVIITPGFIAADLAWWPLFILGLPAVLAVVISIEFRAIAIGFDASGVRYRSVGYQLAVPWSGVQLQTVGGKPILLATEGERQFFPWLDMMHNILSVLMPRRANFASRAMETIPLYYFMTASDDAVMADLRAVAPAGFV